MKVAVIGCGLRTPLLIYGLAQAGVNISHLVLYDIEPDRSDLMAELGKAAVPDSRMRVGAAATLEAAVDGASFVISSIRVGDMETRARDERIAVDHGFAGQETTGPAGFAMALRTIPVSLEHARIIENRAPGAWIINFTNPAGLITQAIHTHSSARVVGICDTPTELFFRISLALGEPPEEVECDYFGLNHLGWVRKVRVRGVDKMGTLLQNDELLKRLYPAQLFSPDLIRALGLIPTEYVYFYYSQRRALRNQLAVGATRGEELLALNQQLFAQLKRALRPGDASAALRIYKTYLNRRNASYFRLEGSGESARAHEDIQWDPFHGETGYHRIAVDAIRALTSATPQRMVLNIPNEKHIEDLAPEDIIEAPCLVDRAGPRPIKTDRLPETVRGLLMSVKAYERGTIRAAVQKSLPLAKMALFTNPVVADFDAASELVQAYLLSDPIHFASFPLSTTNNR